MIDFTLAPEHEAIRSRVRDMAGLVAEFAPLEEGKIEWMSPVPTPDSFAMAYLSNGAHIGMLSWPEGSFGWRTMDRVGRDAAVAPGIEAFAEAFRGADGGMRDAESTLDQLISFCGNAIVEGDVLSMFGLTARASLLALTRAVLAGEVDTALRELNDLAKNGKDLGRLVTDLLNHFRNLLIYLEEDASQQLLTSFAGLLKEGGLLIVGSAESGKVPSSLYSPIRTPFVLIITCRIGRRLTASRISKNCG